MKRFLVYLLPAMIVFITPVAQGQEYIKQINGLKGAHTLVREYRNDYRIISNYQYDSTTIVMVTENGITAPYISIQEDMYISDMEVFGDTLFICGTIYRGRLIGYVGFVDLTTFPASSVRIALMDDLASCSKLEVFRSVNDNSIHVVATAQDRNNRASLVDFRKDIVWSHFRSTGDYYHRVYDDVAATSHYVAVTVRNTSDSTGCIYFFGHPTPGNHIFYSPVIKNEVYSEVASEILIEGCESDYCVTVCKREAPSYIPIIYAPTILDVVAYNTVSMYAHTWYYDGDASDICTSRIRDVKYNNVYKETDVLLGLQYEDYINSMIFHIDTNGYLKVHLYDYQDIRSLDFLHNDTVNFIASGYGKQNALWFYKYDPHVWKRCSERIPWNLLAMLDREDKIGDRDISFLVEEPFVSFVIQREGTQKIDIKCYDNMKKDEE